ncbi:ferredoxin [Streptomyces sp. NPDC090052]|uniref:ferredoxin n=1 Tax=unclassified Streptomyces TaxID=2593676 RepID=UPI002253754B|nr:MULTISPECIES: ferredoxin [unclassified Streptomyces]MCX4723203.1 ferredoxin [Streptomyces sp. NBC_01306]WSV07176.1 ferredoxin [Streptomyces sp. NBC_01020]WSX45290.1 ferredoxin [Streptomyces sp. NBC_00963]WSX66686.1 ferredoxin [Streptomyces sp. NBC_00932]
MRVLVDDDRCVGAGCCVLAAPDLFEQNDEDGRVFLLIDNPGSELRDAVLEAIDVCPADALKLIDE